MRREMGGRFKKEGTCVYLRQIHVDILQKTAKFCKAIFLQSKIELLKKKKHTLSRFETHFLDTPKENLFNFVDAVTIHIHFGADKNEI